MGKYNSVLRSGKRKNCIIFHALAVNFRKMNCLMTLGAEGGDHVEANAHVSEEPQP